MTQIDADLLKLGKQAKLASKEMAHLSANKKNEALNVIADAIESNEKSILEANQKDLQKAKEVDMELPLQERLTLNTGRIKGMANGLRKMARLEDPLAAVDREWTSDDGLRITQRRVPLGVIGIIYESRPNVTIDASGLCLKAGNAVILRGSRSAMNSNIALVGIVQEALTSLGLNPHSVQLLTNPSYEVAGQFMRLNDYVDCLIPRGGQGLINRVVTQATVPVIETGAGNTHLYIEKDADLEKATAILHNGKTQRNSVCNALENLLVDQELVSELPQILKPLIDFGVEIRGDERVVEQIDGAVLATEEDFETEYLADIISVKLVDSYQEAVDHISHHSTQHSDAIVTENYSVAQNFLNDIDSAVVYVNASTRFTDGEMFGFGGEMGISTQKLHARGPMGLEALTSYKYTVQGDGQIRG
ncbi:glutamate-5-semialdehyde dehydrogenase [Aerococcaceae bacterium DSM 111176]|nr:glutamate-5-semialdehyde dehydrogenase [Aerococcaceae bacterium DSM 111176]